MKALKQYLNRNEERRNAWVIANLRKLDADKKILDAGAGELRYKQYCSHLHYVSQDFCQYDGKGNKEGLQTESWDTSRIDIVGDITSIPVEDKSFDYILCTEVFEHIPTPNLALKEFARILKPGGKLMLTAPFCSLTHFAPFHFYTGFNRYFYEEFAKQYQFKIESIEANGDYRDYIDQEMMRVILENKQEKNPFKLLISILSYFTFKVVSKTAWPNSLKGSDLLCFGYHVKMVKS